MGVLGGLHPPNTPIYSIATAIPREPGFKKTCQVFFLC